MKIDSLGKYAVFALADFRRSKKWRTSKILNDMYTLVDMQDSMINGSEDMLNFPKVINKCLLYMFTILKNEEFGGILICKVH